MGEGERIRLQQQVPEECAGLRLDQAAARLFPDYSRARMQAWIRDGALLVDGEARRPRDPVAAGALLAIDAELQADDQWSARAGDIQLVHEDAHLLVIDKPPGLVVHPAAGHRDDTLVNRLLAAYPELSALPRAGIIHRLDKDTSGLLVVARTLAAHNALVSALQARDVHRQYVVLVQGKVTGGGTVEAPLGRHPRQRKLMAVVPGGKAAVTHYRLRERLSANTLLTCLLETGRTHQIRVHMAHIRHPVVGDPQYGGRMRVPAGCSLQTRDAIRAFQRQALHAEKLGFHHPAEKREMQFTAPIPADMMNLIEVLRKETEQA